MIGGCNVFNKPVNDNSRTHYYIRKITTGQEDGYTNGFLLGYNCFNKQYKMIAINLSKQQALDTDPKEMQKLFYTKSRLRAKCKFNKFQISKRNHFIYFKRIVQVL